MKTADRPLLILTLIPNDKHPRSQIRNSQRYLQTPVNQHLNTTRIFSALRLPSSMLRNMPFRGAIDGLLQHDRWPFEMRYMPNLNSKHAFSQNVGAKGRSDSAKTALWLHGSRKITTQVSNQKTRQARLRNHSPQPTPLGFTPNRSLDRNRWVVRILRILFNSCQRFFRHLASGCVSP